MSSGDGRLGGRYELGEIIGRGGMSTVYRSYDHRTGRDVAVKVFCVGPEIADGAQRVRREVALQAGLCDPGIVTVFDAELDTAAPYLVTELVDGPTLSQQICQAPLTETQVIRLAGALARTLAYVHDHGIVHRDVKPSNILLPNAVDDPFTAPKLVDFGIAISAEATRLTAIHLTLGTANYLSPEQIRGQPLTPATDIYSLGLVLIEALTGRPAYPGTGLEAAMARLERPPVIPDLTRATLRATLTAMTAADPADRPDAAQVGRQLDGLQSTPTTPLSLSAAAAPTPARSSDDADVGEHSRGRPRRSHTVATAAVVIAALAGVAIAAGFVTHKPSPADPAPPPGYAAPTTSSSTAHPQAATARPHPPPSASAPERVANPIPSATASTVPTRRPTSAAQQRTALPTPAHTPTLTPSTSPTSIPPSTPTAPSTPVSPSTPESPSDPTTPTPTPTSTTSPP